MIKVPRINVGVEILHHWGKAGTLEMTIESVDHMDKVFKAGCSLGGMVYKFEDYRPAPTINNFMRAIGEWDYHYRALEDQRWVDEGKEYEQALIELFRKLPQEDQYNCRKIAEIVILSVEKK